MIAPNMTRVSPAHMFTEMRDETRNLRDEVAKIAYAEIVADMSRSSFIADKDAPAVAAKSAFDFAEAFMRQRYERDSALRAMQQARITTSLDADSMGGTSHDDTVDMLKFGNISCATNALKCGDIS